jgi:hypothetical protein
MKKLFTYLFLIFSITTFAKKKVDSTLLIDKLSFDYINMYREYHGVAKVKWSDENYKISVSHTNKLIEYNKKDAKSTTLFHSKSKTFENCMSMGWNGKDAGFKNSLFYDFVKTYFNKNKEDLTKEDYLALLPIWSWHNSPKHKDNLLNTSHTVGSTHIGLLTQYVIFKSGKHEYDYTFTKIFSVCNFN